MPILSYVDVSREAPDVRPCHASPPQGIYLHYPRRTVVLMIVVVVVVVVVVVNSFHTILIIVVVVVVVVVNYKNKTQNRK